MPLYFAYGSNLSLAQMKRRCPTSKLIGSGCLIGYRLDFTHYSSGWGGGVADIVPDPKHEVWGLIYKLSTKDLHYLDSYEGYPNIYTRFQVTIKTSTCSISNVWVYSVVQKSNFIPPTKAYLGIIKNAASKYQFPKKYRLYLASIKTI